MFFSHFLVKQGYKTLLDIYYTFLAMSINLKSDQNNKWVLTLQ